MTKTARINEIQQNLTISYKVLTSGSSQCPPASLRPLFRFPVLHRVIRFLHLPTLEKRPRNSVLRTDSEQFRFLRFGAQVEQLEQFEIERSVGPELLSPHREALDPMTLCRDLDGFQTSQVNW